jgi:hypothetical protein
VSLGVGLDRAGIERVCVDAVLTPPVRRLDREQDVGGLRLPIGEQRVVRAEAEIDVIEHDRRPQVGARGHGDDPSAARRSQRRLEAEREREVTEMVGRELRLPAGSGMSLGRGHHSRVVHEDVEGPTPVADKPVHLHALAGRERRVRRLGQAPERVPPSIQQLIGGWHGTPAFVQGRRLDVLEANPLATVLSPLFPPGANLLRATFLDPAVRTLYGDQWESLADVTIAGVRALIGPEVDDPLLDELVGELSVRSDHFRTLWAQHDIRARISGGMRHMYHNRVGELELHCENLQIAGADGQPLIIYHADPHSPTAQALEQLASLAQNRSPSSAPTDKTATNAQPGAASQSRPR